MQGDPRFFSGEGSPFYPHAVDGHPNTNLIVGDYTYGIPNTVRAFPTPLNGIEFEPSEICPKNFIIFDQTDNRGKIMFHPTLAHKFGCPGIDSRAASIRDVGKCTEKCNEDEGGFSSSFKEDTEEINALLSSDDDDEDESDDVVSTARTLGKWGDSSPDSYFSTGSSDSSEMKFTSQNSFSSGGSQSEGKRERVRKMVNALRGIIPGGESMDTTVILDEAVKYLKSLKNEAKKLGIRNLKD